MVKFVHKIVLLFIFVSASNSQASQNQFDPKNDIKFNKNGYQVDLKKSKGELCENLDSPIWEKDEDGDVVRFGENIFFGSLNKGKQVDKESDTDCTFEFNTVANAGGFEKTIDQKCKTKKLSTLIKETAKINNNQIQIDYKLTGDKKTVVAKCILTAKKDAVK